MPDQRLLLFIAKNSFLHGSLCSSTNMIASELGISQQSVSRKLRELNKAGLIEFSASPKGIKARPTEKGLSEIKKNYFELKQIFDAKPIGGISGTVKSGLGEGAYYVSQPQYQSQFKKILGFKPYPGTLNLVVDETELSAFLSGIQKKNISGFKTSKRSFGPIVAFGIAIDRMEKGAIVFPERSTHPKNEIEIISPVFLRGKLGLSDGKKLKLLTPQ